MLWLNSSKCSQISTGHHTLVMLKDNVGAAVCCLLDRLAFAFFLFFFVGLQGNCPPSARWQRYRTNLVCARTAAQKRCVQAISPWQAIPNGASKTFWGHDVGFCFWHIEDIPELDCGFEATDLGVKHHLPNSCCLCLLPICKRDCCA